jgi:outer membrane protein OmpA-like peptidoglycan-associated protein
MKKHNLKSLLAVCFVLTFMSAGIAHAFCLGCPDKEARRKAELETLQKTFSWWPTDAKPAPVKDEVSGGYWWWPTQPGTSTSPLWGNRGYVYVYKVIFDYKEEELPAPKPKELRPSLIIKKIIKNVKIYFDYNKSEIRDDAALILVKAVQTLKNNPEADILVTGNCDIRGSEAYNEKLGRKRAEAVKNFMEEKGIAEKRVRIISRGKLDAVAHVTDLVGMQKDRNAQFMIAEVEEVMIPYAGATPEEAKIIPNEESAPSVADKKVVEEKENVESNLKVSTKEYVIQKNDSLWSIAAKQLGSGHRWKYLYEINKDKIKNPNKLKVGTKIVIPIE